MRRVCKNSYLAMISGSIMVETMLKGVVNGVQGDANNTLYKTYQYSFLQSKHKFRF